MGVLEFKPVHDIGKILGVLEGGQVCPPDATREKWLETRRLGVGGSDIGVLMYVNRWKNKLQLCLDKRGGDDDGEEAPIIMRVGSYMEEFIRDETAKMPDIRDIRDKVGTIQHATEPIALANVDAIALGQHGPCVLEFKNVGQFSASEWSGNQVPERHVAQVQWYMGILRSLFPEDSKAFDHAWVIGLLANRSLERRLVMFDQEYFDKALHRAKMFWQHVEDDTAPIFMDDVDDMDPSVYDSVLQAYPGKEDSEVYRFEGGDDNDLLWAYNAAKDQCKAAEQELKRIKAKIGILLGDATEGRSRDFDVAWPVIAGRGRLDVDALAKAHPDIDMDRFKKTGKGYRGALRITRKEGA